MAVLAEAISVIVRKDSIEAKLDGGWAAFLRTVPNATLCHDEQLARVGFMSSVEVKRYAVTLEEMGSVFVEDGSAVDLAIVDQEYGPTTKVPWLQFHRANHGDAKSDKMSICWMIDPSSLEYGNGITMPGLIMKIAVPIGWEYESSLSAHFIRKYED